MIYLIFRFLYYQLNLYCLSELHLELIAAILQIGYFFIWTFQLIVEAVDFGAQVTIFLRQKSNMLTTFILKFKLKFIKLN